ncbi:MAG: CrcB family protein [Deltaproteobacteria bacterium]
MNVLWVALGGGVGSALRYLVGVGAIRAFGATAYPWGTFVVNVLGSVLLGVLVTKLATAGSPGMKLALTTGAMGGFTTYSTFNLEVHRLIAEGRVGLAVGYLGATLVTCLGATAITLMWMRS